MIDEENKEYQISTPDRTGREYRIAKENGFKPRRGDNIIARGE
jgi:hypothetical protein